MHGVIKVQNGVCLFYKNPESWKAETGIIENVKILIEDDTTTLMGDKISYECLGNFYDYDYDYIYMSEDDLFKYDVEKSTGEVLKACDYRAKHSPVSFLRRLFEKTFTRFLGWKLKEKDYSDEEGYYVYGWFRSKETKPVEYAVPSDRFIVLPGTELL